MTVITDERTAAFIESMDAKTTPGLERIEKEAETDGVPIIRRSMRSLMRFILETVRPKEILEIGTATGYSASFMATYGPEDIHIDTIENFEKRIDAAKKNISSLGFAEKINLIEGDAEKVLQDLSSKEKRYDLIFMDAAKAQYINYLKECRTLLREGGVLISDNVLFDGDIVLSRFAVRRRDRTIHARMREYLRTLSEDEEFVTTILPIGDGVTLSVKKQAYGK